MPVVGSAANAAAEQHYIQFRRIADAHAVRNQQLDSTAEGNDHSTDADIQAGDSGGSAAHRPGACAVDSKHQQPSAAGQAFAAAAAAFGCRLQAQPAASAQTHQRQHPLRAYIWMWRLRHIAGGTTAEHVVVEPEVLVSSRQASVNADIAVCEAELASLLRQQSAAAGSGNDRTV